MCEPADRSLEPANRKDISDFENEMFPVAKGSEFRDVITSLQGTTLYLLHRVPSECAAYDAQVKRVREEDWQVMTSALLSEASAINSLVPEAVQTSKFQRRLRESIVTMATVTAPEVMASEETQSSKRFTLIRENVVRCLDSVDLYEPVSASPAPDDNDNDTDPSLDSLTASILANMSSAQLDLLEQRIKHARLVQSRKLLGLDRTHEVPLSKLRSLIRQFQDERSFANADQMTLLAQVIRERSDMQLVAHHEQKAVRVTLSVRKKNEETLFCVRTSGVPQRYVSLGKSLPRSLDIVPKA